MTNIENFPIGIEKAAHVKNIKLPSNSIMSNRMYSRLVSIPSQSVTLHDEFLKRLPLLKILQ
jgi:hypothetical protein